MVENIHYVVTVAIIRVIIKFRAFIESSVSKDLTIETND